MPLNGHDAICSAAHPQTGGEIKWNFTKFLVDRNGTVVQRFEPAVTPEDPQMTATIEKLLQEKATQ